MGQNGGSTGLEIKDLSLRFIFNTSCVSLSKSLNISIP